MFYMENAFAGAQRFAFQNAEAAINLSQMRTVAFSFAEEISENFQHHENDSIPVQLLD